MLARLALSAVCRLTPLSPEDVADLKLAVTEAANDYVDESEATSEEGRLDFSFALEDDFLRIRLEGPQGAEAPGEQELGRAIIEATVDEARYTEGRTELVKRLPSEPG